MHLPSILLEVNWTNISSNWVDYAISGYSYVFENYFYPIVFLGIVGYVYAINRSATSAAAAICLIFTIFGFTNVFTHPELSVFSQLNWVVVVISLSALFATLFIKKYR